MKFCVPSGNGWNDAMWSKTELRKRMKAVREQIQNRDEREERALSHFFQSELSSYSSYFIYRSFGSEAQTDKLIQRLKESGKIVLSPRVQGKEMVAVLDDGRYQKGAFGILEPLGKEFHGQIDVCILPFLAADKQGGRLGYGGGYYDRFLKKTPCVKVGYGYEEQICLQVPTEDGDERIDGILTEEGLSWVTKRDGAF